METEICVQICMCSFITCGITQFLHVLFPELSKLLGQGSGWCVCKLCTSSLYHPAKNFSVVCLGWAQYSGTLKPRAIASKCLKLYMQLLQILLCSKNTTVMSTWELWLYFLVLSFFERQGNNLQNVQLWEGTVEVQISNLKYYVHMQKDTDVNFHVCTFQYCKQGAIFHKQFVIDLVLDSKSCFMFQYLPLHSLSVVR